MLALWEGFICVIMFAPIAMICGSLGGLVAGLLLRLPKAIAAKNACLAVVALLPLLTHPWLHDRLTRRDLRSVENVRVIHASPDIVWKNIERVPRIARAELPFSWAHRIGFPSPVEATLSNPGIGGVCPATFEAEFCSSRTLMSGSPNTGSRFPFTLRRIRFHRQHLTITSTSRTLLRCTPRRVCDRTTARWKR